MSEILFPAGATLDHTNLSLEEIQHYSSKWSIEHMQMEKGHLNGSMSIVYTPHIQFSSGYYARKFMSKGDFPQGCIVLIYSPNDTEYNFQNRTISRNEIIVLGKGEEIDVLTQGKIILSTIVVDEQLFYRAFFDYFNETPDLLIQSKRFHLNPKMVSNFHQSIASWTSYLRNEYPKGTSKPEYTTIESKILRSLFTCIVHIPLAKKKRKFQARQIRDFLHANIEEEVDVSFMTRTLDISTSQFHYSFKKEYGYSPKDYLQKLRLNAVKKELLISCLSTVSVSEIAYKYHFFHMGHFSAAYKKLFGEAPSITLKRKD